MRLSDIRPAKGANRPIKRRGCGSGSGHGKTSCRGHKGAGQRSGTTRRFGFEGGQMPLIRRIPKRGFNSHDKEIFQIVNLDQLKVFKDGETVNPGTLKEKDLIKSPEKPVKILGDGQLNRVLTVSAHRFSKSALDKIQKAGGKAELLTSVMTKRV